MFEHSASSPSVCTNKSFCHDDLTHSKSIPLVPSQKTKLQTSSSTSRLIPKKIWKSRSKSSARSNSIIPQWTSQGHCRWLSSNGRWYTLSDTSLLELTEMERTALKQIASARLHALKLGCKIDSPKEHSSSQKKGRPYMLKKKALTTGMFDRKEKRNQEMPSGLVFGTSLGKCLENDKEMRQKTLSEDSPRIPTRSRSTTHASLLGKTLKSAASCHSLSDILVADDDSKQSLLSYGYSESNESLDLDKRSRLLRKTDSTPDLISSSCGYNQEPCVPSIVQSCFRHLETFGLNTVGIFRVSSSKRRVRQLRDDFDSGKTVVLNEENHPHDVAQLLKEYFRDLREPLLSKELYSAFIASKRLKNIQDQREALQYLLSLLPIPNRDTLWALLNFLSDVASCAEDSKDEAGELITGNKMDSHNLATLFGPNILRSHKSGPDKEYKVESTMRAEERCDVIRVTQTLIDHYGSLFTVNADLLDHVYLHIQQKDQNSLNALLCFKSNVSDNEAENEPFSGYGMKSRKLSDSVETIIRDDSSGINSPLGSASSFNEITFMDADEVRNGYSTRRGHSASNLPILSQERNKIQSGKLLELRHHHDHRRRSSEDVNNIKSGNSLGSVYPSDKSSALSVPDVSFRRLSSPEINQLSLPGITPISLSTNIISTQTPSPSATVVTSTNSPTVEKSSPAKSSPEEATKPILKSPTEHFKVFVTDENMGTERLAGEFQTVKFTSKVVESTRINRCQRPQVCHLLTMPQPAIMRLPKFTLSESTIEEDTSTVNGSTEKDSKNAKIEPAASNPPSKSSSSSKLHGLFKSLINTGGDKNKQHANVQASDVKNVDASAGGRRQRPKAEEPSSPTRTRRDFMRRRRVRDKNAPKTSNSPISKSSDSPKSFQMKKHLDDPTVQTSDTGKRDQWKRWEIIASEHMETYV